VEVSIVELAVDLLDGDKCAKSKLRNMVWKCNAKRMTARGRLSQRDKATSTHTQSKTSFRYLHQKSRNSKKAGDA
jgi:hypothetical protein